MGKRGEILPSAPRGLLFLFGLLPLHSGLRWCPKALGSLDPRTWRDFVSRTVGGPGVGKVGLQESFCLLSTHLFPVCSRIFLLECSVREVRVAVATVLEKTLDSALFYQDKVGLVS